MGSKWILSLMAIAIIVMINGCSLIDSPASVDDGVRVTFTPVPEELEEEPPSPGEVLKQETIEEPTVAETPTALPTASHSSEVLGKMPEWPAPVKLPPPFGEAEITAEQLAAAEALYANLPAERNDVELARSYQGWTGELPVAALVDQPLAIGTKQTINVLYQDSNIYFPMNAELLAESEHAYFWFDADPGGLRPTQAELDHITQLFDQLYDRTTDVFGKENIPGVDGDPRMHVVNASPWVICDVNQENAESCGLIGYFSSSDLVPSAVNPESNAREMFVMNANYFGSDIYVNALVHELRHMIEDNHDRNEIGWATEGSAVFAEDVAGFPENGVWRANIFLSEPDRQLNSWPDENTTPAYGYGYLLNRYIYDRLGPDLYGQFAIDPAPGLAAVDDIAQENNLDLTGEDLWLDWLATLALIGNPNAPDPYRFGVEGLDEISLTEVRKFPAEFEETVHQYAADTYRLKGSEDVVIEFSGNGQVPVLGVEASSGNFMWVANRANYSHATLTRAFDLTGVDSATLNYNVAYDIEEGYDYAYLFVSEDGGNTWQALAADGMVAAHDEQSRTQLTDHYYTGISDGWQEESVDLTPFAGKPILIRFAYVTDEALTHAGIAFDDISIPEIGFYDSSEGGENGWQATGFVRTTATIPQNWHLQLITFPNGKPEVSRLALSENQLSYPLSLGDSDGEALLIIAATAPMTMELAPYRLMVTD